MPSVVGGLFNGIHEESIKYTLYIYIAYIMLAALLTLSVGHTQQ